MDSRTFSPPDVRFDTEIEFCSPSWSRKGKYVSVNHWITTKTAPGRRENLQRTLRYKLYEMGHFAGAVILEVGVSFGSSIAVPIRAAVEAGHQVQYYGIDHDRLALQAAHAQLRKKKLLDHGLLFRGNLSNFRNAFLVTPTMVVINRIDDVEGTLKHLALFLAHGTPVLIPHWYESRADLRCAPSVDGFEFCGRFGESVLLMASVEYEDQPCRYFEDEFQALREKFGFHPDAGQQTIQAVRRYLSDSAERPKSGKKWPFARNEVEYPETLPDGTPWPKSRS